MHVHYAITVCENFVNTAVQFVMNCSGRGYPIAVCM